MKQNITSTSTTPAQDYQRGWEISQKEYLRQHAQEQRQKRNYTTASSSTSRK